ncbi:tor signaling pathway protein [Grosmannia clavigera kw1407]|uniref:Tor signaling pathway protein n=1 Tax=Grosmannia clavigera (strain kw1407 / UAMH 11150) TaxID=655863 RepID=F0XQ12_GROCL|nr:tor signaling pathway protein [Grosmannia clavigera kw1407]EFX00093.1 tor signaling pathway protein [Grosmannia clavigera kw1407]
MHDVTDVDEPFLVAGSADDVARATRTHVQGHWRISVRKLPISRAAAIDALTAHIGIPIPEMIFGDNEVALCHVPTGWTIRFCAADALDAVDKTGRDRLQVAHAGDWARSRETSAAAGIADVRPYDWSYSTTYTGTEGWEDKTDGTDGQPQPPKPHLSPSSAALPLDLLRRRDPIVFHDDVILYESELDDNGISVLRVKIRVMPQRLLLLCRLYMRLDHVIVRVRDTRVYVDFASDRVLREYTAREAPFAAVQQSLALRGLRPDAVVVAMRDADRVADLLPVVHHSMEEVDLGQAALNGDSFGPPEHSGTA